MSEYEQIKAVFAACHVPFAEGTDERFGTTLEYGREVFPVVLWLLDDYLAFDDSGEFICFVHDYTNRDNRV